MNYLQEIENEFSRLRGRWSPMSPIDWNLAAGWEKKGIPLRIVFSAMGDVDKKFKDKNPNDSINSLRYFEKSVENEFAEWQKSQVGKSDYIQEDDINEVSAFAVSSAVDYDNSEALNYLGAKLEVRNLPEPLNSAVAKAQTELIKLIADSKQLSTDAIERRLEAISVELDLSLVVSIPENERVRMLDTIKRDYEKITITAESRQKLLIKQAYEFFGLPKLTLFEL
jgi:hypothetical protein